MNCSTAEELIGEELKANNSEYYTSMSRDSNVLYGYLFLLLFRQTDTPCIFFFKGDRVYKRNNLFKGKICLFLMWI